MRNLHEIKYTTQGTPVQVSQGKIFSTHGQEHLQRDFNGHLTHTPSSPAMRPINLNVFSQNILVWEE